MITLSRDKFQFGVSIKFGCYSSNEYTKIQPEKGKINKIKYFGLLRTLGSWTNKITASTTQMRELVKVNMVFNWIENHTQESRKVKEVVAAGDFLSPRDKSTVIINT